jgi:hypothetical protein
MAPKICVQKNTGWGPKSFLNLAIGDGARPSVCQLVPISATRSRRIALAGEKMQIPSMGLDALRSYKPWFGMRPRITLDEEFRPEFAQRATPD